MEIKELKFSVRYTEDNSNHFGTTKKLTYRRCLIAKILSICPIGNRFLKNFKPQQKDKFEITIRKVKN